MPAETDEKLIGREYFERTTRRVSKFLIAFICLGIVLVHAKAESDNISPLFALPADVALISLLVFSVIPMTRMVVILQPNGVGIRNKWWKNYFFTWDEISRFSFGDPNAPVLDQVAIVELKNGDYVPLHALYMANQFTRPDKNDVKVMTQELQRAKELADANNGRLPPEMIAAQ